MASGITYSSEDVIGVIFQDEGSDIEGFSAASDDNVD